MNWLELKHIDTSKILSICLDQQMVKCSGREKYISDAVTYEVIVSLISNQDGVTTYSSICGIVNKTKNTDSTPDNTIANKYIFKVRDVLKEFNINDVFQTIRNQGYKLSDKWALIDVDAIEVRDNEFLVEVRSIIADCISYSDNSELTHDKSGLSYVQPTDDVLIGNFKRMNSCYHLFMGNYSRPGNSAELMEVRNKLNKLLSYCIYWRVGDGLTDEKWKADFKNELAMVLKKIESNTNLID